MDAEHLEIASDLEAGYNGFWATDLGQVISNSVSPATINLLALVLIAIGIIAVLMFFVRQAKSPVAGLKSSKAELEAENKALKAKLEGLDGLFAVSRQTYGVPVSTVRELEDATRDFRNKLLAMDGSYRWLFPNLVSSGILSATPKAYEVVTKWEDHIVVCVRNTELSRRSANYKLDEVRQDMDLTSKVSERRGREVTALQTQVDDVVGVARGLVNDVINGLKTQATGANAAARLAVAEERGERNGENKAHRENAQYLRDIATQAIQQRQGNGNNQGGNNRRGGGNGGNGGGNPQPNP